MGNWEDKDFYHNLSRKELQGLCKKHGLSANKTNSNLVKLLVSFFQKKANWSRSLDVPAPTSSTSQLEPVPKINPMGEIHKDLVGMQGVDASDADSCGPSSCSKEAKGCDSTQSQTVNQNEVCSSIAVQMSMKASGETLNMPMKDNSSNGTGGGLGYSASDIQVSATHQQFNAQSDTSGLKYEKNESLKSMGLTISDQYLPGFTRDGGSSNVPTSQCRNINSSACSAENKVASAGTSAEVPLNSFQFYVWSEEGINLHVDLNSNVTDWIKGLKNEVCIYQKVPSKSRVLHQELRRLADGDEQMKTLQLQNSDLGHQTAGDLIYSGSCLNSILNDEDQLQAAHEDGIDGSLRSFTVIRSSNPEVSGNLKEDNELFPSVSTPNSSLKVLVASSMESCPMDLVTLHSEPPHKVASSSVLETNLDQQNCLVSSEHHSSQFGSTCPENFKTVCNGNSNVLQERNLLVSGKTCEDLILLNNGSLENPSEVCAGSSSVSMEMQFSEVASRFKGTSDSPFQNCGVLDLDNQMQKAHAENGRSVNYEPDQSTCGDPPSTYAEEWERSSPINVRESSECSQIDNSSERTCKRTQGSVFSEGIQNKKSRKYNEGKIGYSKHAVKNLRSAKHLAREVLPRRSSRLVSK